MSMQISGTYKGEYLERVQTGRSNVNGAFLEQRSEDKNKDMPMPRGEYINSEKSESKPSGLYRLGQDENGNPKVMYDDPKKAQKAKNVKAEEASPKKEEECTTNTDTIDREIERLKEEKKQLTQQIRAAAGDAEKVRELEKKLAQIEAELSRKDNDTYRRQNAVGSVRQSV